MINENKIISEKFVFNPKNPVEDCTQFHPPLSIKTETENFTIYAGSCFSPNHPNADVYISLDNNISVFSWEQPWNHQENKQHIRFFIKDMSVPEDPREFDNLLNYTLKLLQTNKTVHVGCIAGHGRTGLFLAALVQKTMAKELEAMHMSAIDYVRENYCDKAVETLTQCLYLKTFYNVSLPVREASDFAIFENILYNETNKTFDDIVKSGLFLELLYLIEDIEDEVDYHKKLSNSSVSTLKIR